MSDLRIGITMRGAMATGYDEPRDALARDWTEFMRFAAPDALWLPIPNIGEAVVDWIKALAVHRVVLTGGDDPGIDSLRDRTEGALLEHQVLNGGRVFGVCRGLQLIVMQAGGTIAAGGCGEEHVARRHRVRWSCQPETERDVNSYHRNGIQVASVPPPLRVAATIDGWVEAIYSTDGRRGGVMWHPERERPYCRADRDFFREVLGLPTLRSDDIPARHVSEVG